MKRAWLILIAVLTVVLVYPATMPSANSPGVDDRPTIYIITPQLPDGDDPSGTEDGDEGDADDLGMKGRDHNRPDGPRLINASGYVTKVWWIYLINFRIR
jgi:hypothetical protein